MRWGPFGLLTTAVTGCVYSPLQISSPTCPIYDAPACDVPPTSPGVDERGCPLPPACVCPDRSLGVDGHCPCFPACETCWAGTSYAVTDSSCCGYKCQSCAPPAAPAYAACEGVEEQPIDGHGCPMTKVCRCPDHSLSAGGACNAACGSCPVCDAGSSFSVGDTSCCGYHCETCPAPTPRPYTTCAGSEVPSYNADGCLVETRCMCPDYTFSTDGVCAAGCGEVLCTQCPDGFDMVADGSCCGVCLSICGDTCQWDCTKGTMCVLVMCPPPAC
ncbi:MAG: hypothetical protein HY903_18190 [Deltaproteobacteria bacterium]|nr:hypothetical protein [Deltaproteobacteria bacterium]